MDISFEYELNRKWIYSEDDEDEIIGETNFVVPMEWLLETFKKLNEEGKFVCKYDDFNQFAELYESETDGELLYRLAFEEGGLIEDLGIVLYV